ncbi:hypothetical protein M2317_001321 [Microbacterium sp. ZKA21]
MSIHPRWADIGACALACAASLAFVIAIFEGIPV